MSTLPLAPPLTEPALTPQPPTPSSVLDQTYTVLVVDDEPDLRSLYQTTLERTGYHVLSASSVGDALACLRDASGIDCVITDYRLPDGTGIDIAQHVQGNYPGLPLCMMTAYGSPDHAVQALKAGAFDYLSKPVSINDLRAAVAQMLAQSQLRQRNAAAALAAQMALLLPGHSVAMHTVHQHMAQLSQTQACVVLQGERGTGKELAARAMHRCGLRAAQPFVVFNCAALSGAALDRALFGSVAPAYDGAFQAAQGGTLLLDDIDALGSAMQIKLLNVLQERVLMRIDGAVKESSDVRLMVSSPTALNQLLDSGVLRQDLFYRLNVMVLDLPPLRARQDDVIYLAQRWLAQHPQGKTMALSAQAMQQLHTHPFNGNVRELNNVLERSVALHSAQSGAALELLLDAVPASAHASAPAPVRAEHDLKPPTINPPTSPSTDLTMDLGNDLPVDLSAHMAALERAWIAKALQRSNNNRPQAAALLGLNVRQLRYRIEQLGLAP
jgi:two-component system, NtrC family, response regulator PilR